MKQISLPPIGLRIIKTALSVFLCLLLLPREPFFACITSVFCQQNSIDASYKVGFSRAYGTVHGAVTGLIFLLFSTLIRNHVPVEWLQDLLNYLVISFGIIVVIYTCGLINKHSSIPLACIVFLGVTTTHAQTDALYYGVNRSIETFLGLAIGLLVNKYVVPPKKTNKSKE